MHIKSLSIQGFKSYRDQTIVDPFSEGINVIVGRNGSGKSNAFAAIRFVLSDAYTSLQRHDRQALLHEGSSSTATFAAYVEIVFDNSDHRFPTGKNETVIRRTIGAKKDEYLLDRKTTPKGEVMSLLETAGFSRSNPYYIVPQGRITHLTNQKDHERLDLLKEVAGTRVYEDRRAESAKIIEETDAKREKINELLVFIEDRMKELDEEKKELKDFQQKDRERRCIEYALNHKELQEVIATLQQIEDDRQEELQEGESRSTRFAEREQHITDLDAKIGEFRQRLALLSLEKRQLAVEHSETVKAQTELSCTIKDLEDTVDSTKQSREVLHEELGQIEATIANKEQELLEVLPQWEDRVQEEAERFAEREQASARLQALRSKQGRTAQFATKADRDAYLSAEVRKVEEALQERQTSASDIETELEEAKTAQKQLSVQAGELRRELEGRKETLRTLGTESQGLKEQRDELIERRKELWREEAKVESNVAHSREELRKAERILNNAIDKRTSLGLRAVADITQEYGIQGVYGPLCELFTVEDRYKTAAEVTAGTSLFHVVCDTDETADKVLKIMIERKAGRVTFMPLNRLQPKAVQYPDSTDAIPMIRKVTFEERDRKAFEQVFSRTVICPNLAIAAGYVRSHGLNAITLDGDKVDRKGALTGGYHDVRRSRIDAARQIKTWQSKLEQDTLRHNEIRTEVIRLDQAVTQLVGRIQIIDNRRRQMLENRGALIQQADTLRKDDEDIRQRLSRLEAALTQRQTDIKSLSTQIAAYRSELEAPMEPGLAPEEQATLTALTVDVQRLDRQLFQLTTSSSELAKQRQLLEIDLQENLRRRREDIRGQLERMNAAEENPDIDAAEEDGIASRKTDLAKLDARDKLMAARASELETEIEEMQKDLRTLQSDVESAQQTQAEESKVIAKQSRSAERYLSKRQLLITRRDECNASIRDLGVLPEEAYTKYTETASAQLLKKLHAAHESLKGFSHVNKKAYEQYNNFTRQRDQLLGRHEELDASADSIHELIESLDQRKDEAITRTFKQVAKNFSEVFEKLVPNGRGRLIMQRQADQEGEDDEEDDLEEAGGQPTSKKRKAKSARAVPAKPTQIRPIGSYTGVAIKVSFNSRSDEGLRISQLSGGQKSLVALAMVFAIQKCDPAPFYLFDEIDANLDTERREAVAAMIAELGQEAQFIITTFRPELLRHADKHFGVIFDDRKVSTIKEITLSDSEQFVQRAAQ